MGIRMLVAVSESSPASSDVVAVSDSAPASSDDGGDQKSKVAAETGRETSGLISEEEQKRRDEKHRIIRQRKRRDVVAARQELARNILDVASTLVTSITTRPSNKSDASVSNDETDSGFQEGVGALATLLDSIVRKSVVLTVVQTTPQPKSVESGTPDDANDPA